MTKLKNYIEILGSALIIVGIFWLVGWPVHVVGHSMENTLSDGKVVWVSKLKTFVIPVEKGDIVVVNITDGGQKEKVIKRIIGTAGDHVIVKDGQVTINGTVQVETYAQGETLGEIDLFVPKNGYFILGDNRTVSKDSRNFGCVYKKDVRGILIFKGK